jgi:hypothetical protein
MSKCCDHTPTHAGRPWAIGEGGSSRTPASTLNHSVSWL